MKKKMLRSLQRQLRVHKMFRYKHWSLRNRKPLQRERARSVLCLLFLRSSIGSLKICQVRKEADILPANVAMNEKIKQLRERWECSMTTCHSEVCFVPTEGPHFALSHDLTEKWAAAMVHFFLVWSNFSYVEYNSFVVLSLLPSTLHPTSRHLIQFQHIPLFQNLRFCRLASTIWQKKKAHKAQSSILFFQTTLGCIKTFCMPRPYNLPSLHLP